jgi:hypothetical protein
MGNIGMSKPLSNRLSSLEMAASQSDGAKRDYHIFRHIINPNGSVHKVLETIIKDGEVIRDDCGRPLG